MDNELTLKLTEVDSFLQDVVKHNLNYAARLRSGTALSWEERIVPQLISEPGLGKTSICWQVAKTMGVQFYGFIGAQFDPAELAGLHFFDKDTKESWRSKPEFLPKEGQWLLLCDEFGQMTMMQKNIMAQLFQEWRLGEHELSPEATIVLASNRLRDSAGVQPTPSHVKDRVLDIHVTSDVDDWLEWALANGIDPSIIAYLRFRNKWFQHFDAKAEKSTSPRGWAKVSTILSIGITNKTTEMAAIAGQVGSGAATDFHGFLRVWRDLPNPDKVLSNPKDYNPLPDPTKRPDVMYALCGAIAHRATQKNADAVVTLARRLPAEFATLMITDATLRDKKLHQSKAIIDWKIKEGANTLIR